MTLRNLAIVLATSLFFGALSLASTGITYPPKQVAEEGTALTFRPTVNFIGPAMTCADNSGSNRTDCTITDSTGYATVADEGVSLTQRATVNFTGAGVVCVDNAGSSRTDCTIAGGGGASPLTTKGDLYTYSTTDDRQPVGADGLCLKANSANATGLEWGTCAAGGSGLTFGEVQRLTFMAQ